MPVLGDDMWVVHRRQLAQHVPSGCTLVAGHAGSQNVNILQLLIMCDVHATATQQVMLPVRCVACVSNWQVGKSRMCVRCTARSAGLTCYTLDRILGTQPPPKDTVH